MSFLPRFLRGKIRMCITHGVGECDIFTNGSLNLHLVCPPCREDLVRYPVMQFSFLPHPIQRKPWLPWTLQIYPTKAQTLIDFFLTLSGWDASWFSHRVCSPSSQRLKRPQLVQLQVFLVVFVWRTFDKSKASSLLVLRLTRDNKGCRHKCVSRVCICWSTRICLGLWSVEGSCRMATFTELYCQYLSGTQVKISSHWQLGVARAFLVMRM